MPSVDDKMESCPLKHYVRDTLWAPYAKKVSKGRPLTGYLTLYSPPMMDIKHLHDIGLIHNDGEVYRGVSAVTFVREHYAEAMKRGGGRPELLLYGNIDHLLTGKSTGAKESRSNNIHEYQCGATV